MANRSALLLTLARQLGIRDPRAVLSVAAQEGLGGGIGDNGTSFGPFQLHAGGALPRGLANPHQWAWSRPGLLYALSQIKKVAGGLQGPAAIQAIVNRFERPSSPGEEIAKALSYYRGGSPVGGMVGSGISTSPTPASQSITDAIINDRSLFPFIGQRQPVLSPNKSLAVSIPSLSRSVGSVPAELFYDPIGGIKFGKQIGAIGGHRDHVHEAFTNPQAELHAIALARRLGLHVSENPYVGGVNPVHAKHSFHYRTFPGLYNGRRLGEAADISGSPKLMAKYYRLLSHGL